MLFYWSLPPLVHLEVHSAQVAQAGPQLVLRPNQLLEGRLHQPVHGVDVLREGGGGVPGLAVLHEVQAAGVETGEVLHYWVVRLGMGVANVKSAFPDPSSPVLRESHRLADGLLNPTIFLPLNIFLQLKTLLISRKTGKLVSYDM